MVLAPTGDQQPAGGAPPGVVPAAGGGEGKRGQGVPGEFGEDQKDPGPAGGGQG